MSDSPSPFSRLAFGLFLPLLPERRAMWRACCSLSLLLRTVMLVVLAAIHLMVPLAAAALFQHSLWWALLVPALCALHWFAQLFWAECCLSLADRRTRRNRRMI